MSDQIDSNALLNSIVMEEIEKLNKVEDRWIENLHRLGRIVYVTGKIDFEKLVVPGEFSEKDLREYLDDIHRALIVFAHSTIETAICDTMQYLLKLHYTYDPIKVLAFLDQKKKFSIEEMMSAGNKTVDQMISDYAASRIGLIDELINNRSFNQKKDVIEQLSAVGIQPKSMYKHLEILDKMMNRRHNIAHKFDYIEKNGEKQLGSIDFGEVRKWTDHLMDFLQALLKEILLSDQLAIHIQGKAKTLRVIGSTEEIKTLIKGVLYLQRLDVPWSKTK